MKKKQHPATKSDKVLSFNYELGRDVLTKEIRVIPGNILNTKKTVRHTGGKPKSMMSEFYF